ncbi:MFS transporter [Micrococcus sp.]|uniref:MFS transporter n=1 Tax=Micrococcus sp. TaxID=1271 RepID=UPI002A914832|nr:MFS transporter [Micrococcus sp.]MDY6054874.1 MFS transporter [Micrococcus sp.]
MDTTRPLRADSPAGNTPAPGPDAAAGETHMTPGARRALTAAVTGTLIEWYDYALYGAAAGLVIGPLFFADADAGTSLAAFATFAVGFVARPLGGALIGHLGDRHGRRPAMLLTILLMGVATVGIGLLPTTAAIGVLAPVLLVLLRLLQGMGAGAELAGAMTLVAEFAPPSRRGLYTSLVLSTPPAGIALATAAFLGVASLGDEALLAGAWRWPFLASAVLFVLAWFIRRRLDETPEYRAAQERAAARGERERTPAMQLLRTRRSALAVAFLSITGHNALNYTMAVFALSFLTSEAVGLSRPEALAAVTLGSLAGVVATPLGGWAADRFDPGTVVALGSLLGAGYVFALFTGLSSGSALTAGLVIAGGYACVISLTSGAQGAFLAGLFPPRQRFSGIGIAREANGALVAGFTPMAAAWLVSQAGGAWWPAAAFVSVCCLSSALAVFLWRRTHPRAEH